MHWWGQMTIAFIIALAFAVFTGVLCVMHIRMVCRRVLSIPIPAFACGFDS